MKDIVRIIQFSDTHFFSSPKAQLCGLNTTDSLMAVVAEAQKKCWPPDLILATGDLSQDETDLSYQRLFTLFESFGSPLYCVPGNHDDVLLMGQRLNNSNVRMLKHVLLDRWQIVLLNSQVIKKNHGHLSKSELDHLEKSLKAQPDHFTMVCLHHHPIPSGSPWMDTMILDNSIDLFSILENHKNVKLIAHGHIHQELHAVHQGITVLGAPSTCIQFTPKSFQFQLERTVPGYRWIDLKNDGSFETGVVRAKNFNVNLDPHAQGY